MFKFRIISFAALLALFALFFLYPNTYVTMLCFVPLAALVGFAMAYELGGLFEKRGMSSFRLPAAVYAALAVLVFCWGPIALEPQFRISWLEPAMVVAFVLILALLLLPWLALLFSGDFEKAVAKLPVSLGVLALSLPSVFSLAAVGCGSMQLFGYFVLTTKAGDTGAYCVGMLSNKISGGRNHPVAPRISPKKSIEGTIGGMIFCVAVSLALGAIWTTWTPGVLALLGFGLFWGGFAGDLTESVLKRGCGVKDSGRILPGMGGIWDIMDSFIYNGPLFYLLFLL
ncbi:MAG: phosphatidate cytidylyltransferase [Victivallaceae bacterium]|nr:phosphatidate cytidylyltransferase [Victivallaceae bacterium]